MDLDLVRIFLAVAEQRSFSAAARAAGRTQAAVSQQIQRLEHQIGETLLHRTTRAVTMTPAGERFLPYARRLTALGDEARRSARGNTGQRLRIGAPDEIVRHGLIATLADLHPELRGIGFDIRVGSTRALLPELGRRVDLVLGLALPDTPGGHSLLRTPLAWIGECPVEGPVPLALYPDGCLMRIQAMAALDLAGRDWFCSVEAASTGAIEAAARHGLAVGVLPECLISPGLRRAEGLPSLPDVEVRLWHSDAVEAPIVSAVAAAIGQSCLPRRRTGS